MYPTPRTIVSGRIPEYLENLKVEFELFYLIDEK